MNCTHPGRTRKNDSAPYYKVRQGGLAYLHIVDEGLIQIEHQTVLVLLGHGGQEGWAHLGQVGKVVWELGLGHTRDRAGLQNGEGVLAGQLSLAIVALS